MSDAPTTAEDLAAIRKALDWIGCLDGRDSIVEAMDKAHEDALQAMERIELRLLGADPSVMPPRNPPDGET